jgi:hypothetical protein
MKISGFYSITLFMSHNGLSILMQLLYEERTMIGLDIGFVE